MSLDWKSLLKLSYLEAQKSLNPSTQNGAILIDGQGKVLVSSSNSFSNRITRTKEREVKLLRHKYSICAERNVLYKAAQLGIKTKGLTMVCGWASCSNCAHAIIQTGIKRLVTHKQALDRSFDWQESIDLAFEMLHEAGVEIIIFDGKIGVGQILRSGKYWEP